MIGLQLQHVLSLNGKQYQKLEQNQMGKFYELLDYWQSQPKINMDFKVGDQDQHIQYVFTPPSLLKYIDQQEKFGAYIGDMMFISSDTAKEHHDWIPYIALKLYAEKFIPDAQMDETGIIKHHQTLYRTVRLAQATMNPAQLHQFLTALRQHERTGFMDMDQEAQDFLVKTKPKDPAKDPENSDFLNAKRVYLERHNRNKWVSQGRLDEDLSKISTMYAGYRNHAQAVFDAVVGSNAIDLYLASAFTAQLASVEPHVPIILQKPFSSLAYAMTRDVNGFVDLVQFKPYVDSKREDIIVRLPGKMKTWTALRKRLSYDIHRLELNVQHQIESDKQNLERLVLEANKIDDALSTQIQHFRALATTTPLFSDARNLLANHATRYKTELLALDQTSSRIAGRLADLESLDQLLVASI